MECSEMSAHKTQTLGNTTFAKWRKFEIKEVKRCLQHMKGLNTWRKEPDNASQHPTTTDQHHHWTEQSVQPLHYRLHGLGFKSRQQ
jgi:hypothetical protein